MDFIFPLPADSSEQLIINNPEGENTKVKKQTQLLRPKITYDTANKLSHQSDESRKNELLTRLENSLKKLKLQEQNINAKWYLDISLPDINENLPTNQTKLPSHIEENIKGILNSAQDYVAKLEEQFNDLDSADQQIEKSMTNTLNDIDETYQALMDEICKEINEKRNLLRLETEIYKNESLIPLKACRQEVKAQINSTQRLIKVIETILKHPQVFNRDRYEKVVNASSNLGRIPAVPYLEELPSISFNRPLNSCVQEVLERLSELGSILHTGPVQITDIKERPACLFLKWDVIDPEYAGEEHIFIVQKANGEILDPASNMFESIYEGPETHCFVRDLPVNSIITLRVRMQTTDTAWSTLRIARTTIQPYKWNSENRNYIITNNGTIAAKITDELSTLYSVEPQFDADHIIEFKFLEASQEGKDDEGVALVFNPEGSDDTLKKIGSLLITPTGKIFMDGQEKLMRLPKMRFGLRIIITAYRKDPDTLRINIECADKGVTYDWRVQTPIYFAARFTEYNKWNVMVK